MQRIVGVPIFGIAFKLVLEVVVPVGRDPMHAGMLLRGRVYKAEKLSISEHRSIEMESNESMTS